MMMGGPNLATDKIPPDFADKRVKVKPKVIKIASSDAHWTHGHRITLEMNDGLFYYTGFRHNLQKHECKFAKCCFWTFEKTRFGRQILLR
jgi:hypothetical protein